jgi:predicted kinase
MKKFLAIIDGPMGSGKTTIGKILHSSLKRTAVLSTDKIKFFISDFERNETDKAITAAVLMQMCKEYIKHDINIVLPQGFWKKEFINPYIDFAKENNLALFIYQLEAPREILEERIRNRGTPLNIKIPVPQERIKENLDNWEMHRYKAEKVFNTSELSPEEVAKFILKDIENLQ